MFLKYIVEVVRKTCNFPKINLFKIFTPDFVLRWNSKWVWRCTGGAGRLSSEGKRAWWCDQIRLIRPGDTAGLTTLRHSLLFPLLLLSVDLRCFFFLETRLFLRGGRFGTMSAINPEKTLVDTSFSSCKHLCHVPFFGMHNLPCFCPKQIRIFFLIFLLQQAQRQKLAGYFSEREKRLKHQETRRNHLQKKKSIFWHWFPLFWSDFGF